MKRLLFISLTIAALGAGALAIAASPAPAPVAASASIGPAIGSTIPLGTPLLDSAGHATTLAKIGGGKPVMIVMVRSAAWCPFCQRQLKGMGPVADAAKARGVRFAAISYDKPEVLSSFAAKQGLTYPMYSDMGSKLIDTLKLRDPQYKADSIAYGVPYPTTLLIDGKGRVKAKSIETDYRIRPTQADQIAMLGTL